MRTFKTAIISMILFIAVIAFAWQSGDRVLGQWSDGYWYPAVVSGISGGNFNISFDDGDTAVLPASKIRKINWGEGTKVQCNWKHRGGYYSGTITRMNGEAIHISYDDGDQEDSTISICRSR